MNNMCVNLCIYVTPEAFGGNDRIEADVRRASAIWNQCQIEFKINSIISFNEEPELNNFIFHDQELTYCGNLKGAPQTDDVKKLTKLLSIRTGCEGTISKYVAVYYIGGNSFKNITQTSCFYFQDKGNERLFSIILTNGARSEDFAHELGHALFVRPNDPNGNYDDPDVQANPNDKIHNTQLCNLMHVNVSGITITQDQCNQANKSQLITKCPLPPEMFREISISGTMHIRDDDDPFPPDECDFKLSPGVLKLGPFETYKETGWLETCDEISIGVHLILEWRLDSSINVDGRLDLYEGRHDLKGQEPFKEAIPKDINNFIISKRVTSKDDDGDSFGIVNISISNNQDPNPPATP